MAKSGVPHFPAKKLKIPAGGMRKTPPKNPRAQKVTGR